MRELCYDIVPHHDGWAIVIAPGARDDVPDQA